MITSTNCNIIDDEGITREERCRIQHVDRARRASQLERELHQGLRYLEVDQQNLTRSQACQRRPDMALVYLPAGIRRANKTGQTVLDHDAGEAGPRRWMPVDKVDIDAIAAQRVQHFDGKKIIADAADQANIVCPEPTSRDRLIQRLATRR